MTALAQQLGPSFGVRAVRLDSGDLLELSKSVRKVLDQSGLVHVRIFASGGLDEWKIDHLVEAGAPIDAFGVGTDMIVSGDAPSLDIAYKLTEYDGVGRMKLSAGKRNLPGRKQVFRCFDDGRAVGDTIARHREGRPGHKPLLKPVMTAGRRIAPSLPLDQVRARTRKLVAGLPPAIRTLEKATSPYPVEISAGLATYEKEIHRFIASSASRGIRRRPS